ncbi:hypothetical protein FB45DRAFT_865852 [Roridomyces roridus]|uniref:Uncharacterized protein n=1 Tax=Roridomyces roridus TaxID=1738132 RepID=A0AAD7C097_9AGAR|nr:hypothetical protein FB45DRAFT_865852 [Roridomyces roridus]
MSRCRREGVRRNSLRVEQGSFERKKTPVNFYQPSSSPCLLSARGGASPPSGLRHLGAAGGRREAWEGGTGLTHASFMIVARRNTVRRGPPRNPFVYMHPITHGYRSHIALAAFSHLAPIPIPSLSRPPSPDWRLAVWNSRWLIDAQTRLPQALPSAAGLPYLLLSSGCSLPFVCAALSAIRDAAWAEERENDSFTLPLCPLRALVLLAASSDARSLLRQSNADLHRRCSAHLSGSRSAYRGQGWISSAGHPTRRTGPFSWALYESAGSVMSEARRWGSRDVMGVRRIGTTWSVVEDPWPLHLSYVGARAGADSSSYILDRRVLPQTSGTRSTLYRGRSGSEMHLEDVGVEYIREVFRGDWGLRGASPNAYSDCIHTEARVVCENPAVLTRVLRSNHHRITTESLGGDYRW